MKYCKLKSILVNSWPKMSNLKMIYKINVGTVLSDLFYKETYQFLKNLIRLDINKIGRAECFNRKLLLASVETQIFKFAMRFR